MIDALRTAHRRVRRMLGRTQPARKRRYIPAQLGVERFFRALDRIEVRYAVLRWFDDLPKLQPGEDIDMLIDDADLPRVADLFDDENGVPCDVYSVSGLPGSAQHGMPYFPPHAAQQLLDRAVRLRGLYRVPCAEDHFLSLAYHALYHKGARSGIPSSIKGVLPVPNPEHDYSAVLRDLAAGLGLTLSIDMEALDAHLAKHGWYPTSAMRERLIERNAWLDARFRGTARSVG